MSARLRGGGIGANYWNPHSANPNGMFGDANAGRITSILAQTERVIRFGGRIQF